MAADSGAPPLWAVVPAAGRGTRMGTGTDLPKQYAALGGTTLIERALATLLAVPALVGVVIALAPDDEHFATLPVSRDPRVHVATGAATRAGSVAAALDHLAAREPDDARVLVHDAARPLVTLDDIRRLTDVVAAGGAIGGLLAVPVQDTLKRAGADHRVLETEPRERLWQAQTPQLFPLGALRRALGEALADAEGAAAITDEASAMERAGHAPQLVEALDPNPKITRRADLDAAEALLGRLREAARCA